MSIHTFLSQYLNFWKSPKSENRHITGPNEFRYGIEYTIIYMNSNSEQCKPQLRNSVFKSSRSSPNVKNVLTLIDVHTEKRSLNRELLMLPLWGGFNLPLNILFLSSRRANEFNICLRLLESIYVLTDQFWNYQYYICYIDSRTKRTAFAFWHRSFF